MAKDTGRKKRALENLEPLLNFRNLSKKKIPTRQKVVRLG